MDSNIVKKLTKRLEGSKFLPYVQVDSVRDYFELPKSERERFGLYRKPFALPCEWLDNKLSVKVGKVKPDKQGWASWESEIRRQYPVQWFLREWCMSWDNPVYAFFKGLYFDYREKKYAVKRFIKPFYPRFRKSMPRHKYCDASEALRKVTFALILDFWYDEIVDGHVNWDDNSEHKNFAKKVKLAVKYIEVDRPALEDRADKELSIATKKKKGTYEQRYIKYNALEKKIADKDTELLVWAMQNREMFWT
jgi:hypothetical protein